MINFYNLYNNPKELYKYHETIDSLALVDEIKKSIELIHYDDDSKMELYDLFKEVSEHKDLADTLIPGIVFTIKQIKEWSDLLTLTTFIPPDIFDDPKIQTAIKDNQNDEKMPIETALYYIKRERKDYW